MNCASDEDFDIIDNWNEPYNVETPLKPHTLPKADSFSHNNHARVIVHIDIDCFYAQVEMVLNPKLKGLPLGIQQKSFLVTCNYEARRLGVNKCMRLNEAKQICPQMIMINGEDLTQYREMSYKITECLKKYSKSVERLGFDENYIDVTELVNSSTWLKYTNQPIPHFVYEDSLQTEECACGCHDRLRIGANIAKEMRASLFTELGITSCAGISHNKLLAKLVGSVHKPNQQTMIYPHQAKHLLAGLKGIKEIPGIGHATCIKLADIGVESMHQALEANTSMLSTAIGKTMTATLQMLCRGIDDSPVIATGPPQSMSDEDSFRDCKDIVEAKTRLSGLLDSLLIRLQKDGRIPQTLRLTVRKEISSGRESRQCPIPRHLLKSNTDSTHCRDQLLLLAVDLLKKMADTSKTFEITLFNVCFAKLQAPSKATSIDNFIQKGTTGFSGDCLAGETNRSNEVLLNKDREPVVAKQSQKRKATIENFFTPTKLNKDSKKPKTIVLAETDSLMPMQTTLESILISKSIDKQVFNSLPLEIQKELVGNTESSAMLESKVNTENRDTGTPVEPLNQLNSVNITEYVPLKASKSSDECSDGTNESNIPSEIDADVFKALPDDIKQELFKSWSQTQPVSSPSNSSKQKNTKMSNNKDTLKRYFKKI